MSTSISFPSNPTLGQIYSYLSVSYVFNGKQWGANFYIPTSGSTIIFPRVDIDASYIDTNTNGDLIFNDPITGVKTLAELATGGGGGIMTPTVLTCASTTNIDLSLSDNFYILLDQNTSFTVSNVSANIGKSGNIVLEQNGVGGYSFIEAIEFKTPIGGAVIAQTTTANTTSIITYYIKSSDFIIINYLGNFA